MNGLTKHHSSIGRFQYEEFGASIQGGGWAGVGFLAFGAPHLVNFLSFGLPHLGNSIDN